MLLFFLFTGIPEVIGGEARKLSDKEVQKKIKNLIKQEELGNKYIFEPKYIDGVLQPPKYEKKRVFSIFFYIIFRINFGLTNDEIFC